MLVLLSRSGSRADLRASACNKDRGRGHSEFSRIRPILFAQLSNPPPNSVGAKNPVRDSPESLLVRSSFFRLPAEAHSQSKKIGQDVNATG